MSCEAWPRLRRPPWTRAWSAAPLPVALEKKRRSGTQETDVRGAADGRKNFICVGDAVSGVNIAGLHVLAAMCEARGLHPVLYVTGVLSPRADHPAGKLSALLPGAWAAVPSRDTGRPHTDGDVERDRSQPASQQYRAQQRIIPRSAPVSPPTDPGPCLCHDAGTHPRTAHDDDIGKKLLRTSQGTLPLLPSGPGGVQALRLRSSKACLAVRSRGFNQQVFTLVHSEKFW